MKNLWLKLFAADRWRVWRGGARPIDQNTWIEVRYRSDLTSLGCAHEFRWKHVNAPSDIIAYRVIL